MPVNSRWYSELAVPRDIRYSKQLPCLAAETWFCDAEKLRMRRNNIMSESVRTQHLHLAERDAVGDCRAVFSAFWR